MNRLWYSLLPVLVWTCPAPRPARAEDAAAQLRMATVDINMIMNELDEAKQAKKNLENLSASARQKLSQQKKELDALEKKIKDKKLPEESDDAVKYRKAAREFQEAAGDAEEQIKREFMKVNRTMSEKVLAAVERFAKERSIDLVLDKSTRMGAPILYGDPSVDITPDILKLLGK